MTKRSKGSIRKKNQDVTDRISELPDDILISIISRLTLREAIATSVLSSRWRPLHTCVSRLNIPPLFSYADYQIVWEFPNYIKMINHTLDSYKGGQTLKEFKVHMYCLKGANMKRWLKFALSKHVEIVDIRLTCILNTKCGHYCLQIEKLIKSGCQTGLKYLRELSLFHVGVDDGDIKLLLSNSPNLESLSLESPHKLRNLSMVGHPKLKHLNLANAYGIESIEMENMINLVSLRFFRLNLPSECVLRFNNLPKLIELDTTEESHFYSTFWQVLTKLSTCIRSQLLLVRLSASCKYTPTPIPFQCPDLINVKHLELTYFDPYPCYPSVLFVQLLAACPLLEKLEMKSMWYTRFTNFRVRDIHKYDFVKELSPNLKKVKLSEYLGSPGELEFAVFVTNKAPSLQELIIKPCALSKCESTDNVWKQLQPQIPNSVNLILI